MDACEDPSCRAPILWARHDGTGRRAPVNATIDPRGNVVLNRDGTYHVLTDAAKAILDGQATMFVDPDAQAEASRYGDHQRRTLHFATCKNPDHFRRCGTCHKTPCACPPHDKKAP